MRKRFIAALFAIMLLIVIPGCSSSYMFTIINPYDHVDWDSFGQYKAAFHVHTAQSDGRETVDSALERHYELGYHIVSINDHNITTIYPDDIFGETLTAERVAEMRDGAGRDMSDGMIFIPGTNEHSGINIDGHGGTGDTYHVNAYRSYLHSIHGEQASALMERLDTEGTGFAVVNHLGRNTGAKFTSGGISWDEAAEISNSKSIYRPFAKLFKNHPRLIGMEIINRFDGETQADRVLWDNILKENMPDVPTWGFSTDDSHSNKEIGFSYNLILMPELSLPEADRSVQAGAFLAFSRVDRQYGIYAGDIESGNTHGGHLTDAHRTAVLDLPVPAITRITVEGRNTITITADNAEFINWYADGELIHTGAEIDLTEYRDSIGGYVRATVGHSNYGVFITIQTSS